MDIKIYVGPNGSGKTTALKKIFKDNPAALYINEEGQPQFNQSKMKVRLDFTAYKYIYNNELERGSANSKNAETETISPKLNAFIKLLSSLVEKNKYMNEKPSKGQEKFTNILMILSEYNLNNLNYICFDEPENFLDEDHIKLVCRLFRELANADIKICIATHSVRLLSEINVNIKDLCILNRTITGVETINLTLERLRSIMEETACKTLSFENRNYTIRNNIKTKLNAYENELFFQALITQTLYNDEFYRCLFNKFIILVEGKSEILAFNSIKNRFESSTEFYTPHGKVYMPFFVEVFKTLKKDVLVIIDGDEGSQDGLVLALTDYFKEKSLSSEIKLKVHNPDFETVYNIPSDEILTEIGISRSTNEFKPIVSMIYFNEVSNRDNLYNKINVVLNPLESVYDFR